MESTDADLDRNTIILLWSSGSLVSHIVHTNDQPVTLGHLSNEGMDMLIELK